MDFIGSDELDCPEVHNLQRVTFVNMRGDQATHASLFQKVVRITRYYARLLGYAAFARPRVFHILWNNKFEWFDRSLLMGYYRLLGKRLVLTAHNVNKAKRDSRDSLTNRLSLWMQYSLSDHIFVHTERMKDELVQDFGVPAQKVTVIEFGMNATNPITSLTSRDAREKLGIGDQERVLLFFGQIAPYKGLEHLVAALAHLNAGNRDVKLVIAGKVKKDYDDYWNGIERLIANLGLADRVLERIQFIPDDEVELYFKAADALVLPYVDVFQSGLLVLAYNFGLPVLATRVGSIDEHVVEGETGFTCTPADARVLAATIDRYFASGLFRELPERRSKIRRLAHERYSWDKVGAVIQRVYEEVLAES